MSESKTPAFARKRAIREYVKRKLVGKTDASDRVFINRVIPTQIEELPVILVYSLGESISRFNEAPKDYKRDFNLRVEIVSAGDQDDDLDERLELIADKVESLLEQDETFGDLVSHIELKSTEYTGDHEAQSPVGMLALNYSVIFVTDAISEISLDDFTGTDIKYSVGNLTEANGAPDGVTRATDTVNVETGD